MINSGQYYTTVQQAVDLKKSAHRAGKTTYLPCDSVYRHLVWCICSPPLLYPSCYSIVVVRVVAAGCTKCTTPKKEKRQKTRRKIAVSDLRVARAPLWCSREPFSPPIKGTPARTPGCDKYTASHLASGLLQVRSSCWLAQTKRSLSPYKIKPSNISPNPQLETQPHFHSTFPTPARATAVLCLPGVPVQQTHTARWFMCASSTIA